MSLPWPSLTREEWKKALEKGEPIKRPPPQPQPQNWNWSEKKQ